MSWRSIQNSVLLQPTLGFIALCALIGVFGIARSMHLIDLEFCQRAIGQIISLMLLVIGNYLPKLRPLQGSRIERALGAPAERFAGRTLFLAGVVSCLLFISLTLPEAKLASAWLGLGTLVMIAGHWTWLAYSSQQRTEPSQSSRTLRAAYWLMIGYGYVCTSDWALNLVGDGPARHELRTWLMTGFSMLLSVVFPVVEGYKNPCRRAHLSMR
jgi:hypothetical protein